MLRAPRSRVASALVRRQDTSGGHQGRPKQSIARWSESLLLVVEVRQRERFLVLGTEEVVERGLDRRLVFLQEDLAVGGHAGSGGDETADDDVLLEAAQVVDTAGDGRFRENARGLLERGRGDEGVGGERGLGD